MTQILLLRSSYFSRNFLFRSRNSQNSRNFFAKGSKTVGWRFACHAELIFPTDCTDNSDFNSSFSSITRFARDFVHTRHNPNKFGFCFAYYKIRCFDFVKRRSSDLHRFYSCGVVVSHGILLVRNTWWQINAIVLTQILHCQGVEFFGFGWGE